MMEQWNTLDFVTQVFFAFAVFFGLLFVWQLVMSVFGLGGHGDVGTGHDLGSVGGHDIGHGGSVGHAGSAGTHLPHGGHPGVTSHVTHPQNILHADDGMVSFQLLSFRSLLAFFTLFTWYTAMMLATHQNREGSSTLFWAIFFGILWGLAGMFAVALVFFLLRKLGETGTSRLETCVGTPATVYADIPEGGMGQVRCTVSGVVTFVKARAAGGKAVKAGTPVQILLKIDDTTVEVEPAVQPT
jgi:hypothetical protein